MDGAGTDGGSVPSRAPSRSVWPWLASYRRSWLSADLLAGLTVAALLVPEGMAYAALAGVPLETAFYAAPVALLAYAALGSSRQLVVAVSATIAVLSAATVGGLAPAGSPEFVTLTAALALLAGAVSVLAGLLRLGRLSQFLSEPVLTGFVSGLALVIALRQVPDLLGIEGGEGSRPTTSNQAIPAAQCQGVALRKCPKCAPHGWGCVASPRPGSARPRVVLGADLDATARRPRVARRPGRLVVARRELEGMPPLTHLRNRRPGTARLRGSGPGAALDAPAGRPLAALARAVSW